MFYEYHQNNSGGSFGLPAINVIIEADNAAEADSIALLHGLYWDGVDKEIDCPCCGDRWYPQDWGMSLGDEGDEVPSHYGKPLDESKNKKEEWAAASEAMYRGWAKAAQIPLYLIYYKDGRVESQS